MSRLGARRPLWPIAHGRVPGSVVLLSGGVDSAVCLAREVEGGRHPLALGIRYGQRHAVELDAARTIAGLMGVRFVEREVVIPWQSSALTGGSACPVVPGRNAIFATLAAAEAQAHGCGRVVMGCCKDDHDAFPDCRPEFVCALSEALDLALSVTVEAPLIMMTKAEIIRSASTLARAAIAVSWSCYDPMAGDTCGSCNACVVRADAFAKAGV